ncbi:hypothetical protein CI610_02902 [invertebrate metagenome]|uniref:Uncharacterized protein n=1 Tax=invertebrate metagenome TaxID=1711999 RepID=A0A2H9T4P1_9ZZZZ
MAKLTGKGTPPKSSKGKAIIKKKGTPPITHNNNLEKPASGELVPLNFKIEPELVRDFKVFAAMHDMKLVELFRKSFENYKKTH